MNLRNTLFSFFCIAPLLILGQNHVFFHKHVSSDLSLSNQVYNNNLSMFVFSKMDDLIRIEKVDTISFTLYEGIHLKYFKIFVTLDCEILRKDIEMNCDTLVFEMLRANFQYFRVFGFFATDISLFLKSYGKEAFNHFVNQMTSNGVLSTKQSRIYKKAICKSAPQLPRNIRKPSQYLKLFGLDDSNTSSSVILEYKPLLPITI